MGHHKQPAATPKLDPERENRNAQLSGALHHALFAHFTRLVADPDHPGGWVPWGELEQRLRARCYRRSLPVRAPEGGSGATVQEL